MPELQNLEEYYKILGLQSTATDEELKKAYRKLALKFHPDLQSGNEAQFKKIVEAYEAILDYRIRKVSIHQLTAEEKHALYEHLKAKAKAKAKEKAHQRAAKLRQEKVLEQNKAYRTAIYSFIGIVFGIYFSFKIYDWHLDWQISKNPQKGIATVVGIERNRVVYQFEHGGQTFEERKYVRGYGIQMFAKTGLPLKTGDQFIVNYNLNDPEYHRLDFYKVSSATFNRYIEIAGKSLQRLSSDPLKPSAMMSEEKGKCIALLCYDKMGLEALGKIYHFDTNPLNFLSQNSLTWYFFKDSEDFQWSLNQCKAEIK